MTRLIRVAGRAVAAGLIALAAAANIAMAQQPPGTSEQQIWTAPLAAPEKTPDIADAGALSPLRDVCRDWAERPPEITEACKRSALDIVDSAAARFLRENELALKTQENRAVFNARNQEHVLSALRDQAWRGEVIFWVVMATVALGLIAAALQFRVVWRDKNSTQTEISLSEKQITIKTAWIGVVLLAMSMIFLGLYLVLVYQINPI